VLIYQDRTGFTLFKIKHPTKIRAMGPRIKKEYNPTDSKRVEK
jgi:hypothetical protein